jgi:AcrR family transcriptional regulator
MAQVMSIAIMGQAVNWAKPLTSTVRFGTGQIEGPWSTTVVALRTQSYDTAPDLGVSARQAEVLACALDLMVQGGDRFSMSALAQAASCSKETLYRWFGDRDGLLTETVRWQAAKVAMPSLPEAPLSAATLQSVLEAFAQSWLSVITGEPSVALNRVAVAHARGDAADLGRIVLDNGAVAMANRLRPVFEAGHSAGLIRYTAFDEAFSTYFGLVIGDVQIRALLGAPDRLTAPDIAARATRAAARFMRLYAVCV